VNEFSQNVSAFNCGLIVFEKLDMVRVQVHGFHGNNSSMATTAPQPTLQMTAVCR